MIIQNPPLLQPYRALGASQNRFSATRPKLTPLSTDPNGNIRRAPRPVILNVWSLRRKAPQKDFIQAGQLTRKLVDRVHAELSRGKIVAIRGLMPFLNARPNAPVTAHPESCYERQIAAEHYQFDLFSRLAERTGRRLPLKKNTDYGTFSRSDLVPADVHVHPHCGRVEPNTLLRLGSFLYSPIKHIKGDSSVRFHPLSVLEGNLADHYDPKHPKAKEGVAYFKPESREKLLLRQNTTRVTLSPKDFTLVFFENDREAHSTGEFEGASDDAYRRVNTLFLA